MLRWTAGLFNRLVFATDGALMLVCGAVLYRPLFGQPVPVSAYQAAVLTIISALAFLFVMASIGAYRLERYTAPLRPYFDLAIGFTAKMAVAILVADAFLPDDPDRHGWLASHWLLTFLVFVLARLLTWLVIGGVAEAGHFRRKTVVIGTGDRGADIMRRICTPAATHLYELVGTFGMTTPRTAGDPSVADDVDALCDYARSHPVDLIIVALPWEIAVTVYRQIEALQRISADIVIMLDESGFNPRFARITSVADKNALQVAYKPLKGTQWILKQVEDYTVAALGLVLCSPVMLLAAIAIRLDSPGPILFRQVRIGFNNKPFTVYKFRSMLVDPADDGSIGIGRGDPRVTCVGRILRRTSVDELPQLFNVLKGDMSVVGPRPHVPNMQVGSKHYYEAVKGYALRYRVKPGITGWAQINGMRGGIHDLDKAQRGVELDITYIENWSLWFDIKIILRTLTLGMVGEDVF